MNRDELTADLIQHEAALKADAQDWLALTRTSNEVFAALTPSLELTTRAKPALNKQLFDGSGMRAVEIFAAGVFSNTTPPDDTWQSQRYRDPEANKSPGTAKYLEARTQVLYSQFAASNFYQAQHTLIKAAARDGCGFLFKMPNRADRTLMFKVLRTGTYYIGENADGDVDTLFRWEWLTGSDVLKYWPKLDSQTQKRMESGRYQRFRVVHSVRPRESYDNEDKSNLSFAFESVYRLEEKILEVGGFRALPYYGVRFGRFGDGPWPSGPSFDALRDGQVMQTVAKAALKLKQKIADPPREKLSKVANIPYVTHPGAENIVTAFGEAVKEIPVSGNGVILSDEEAARLRQAIEDTFQVPFFYMQEARDKEMTRAEFLARQAQDSQRVLPYTGQVMSEELDVLIDAVAEQADEFGLMPKAPDTMTVRGVKPVTYYTNPLTAIQKRATTLNGAVEYVSGMTALGQLVAIAPPELVDTFNIQDLADKFADANGMDDVKRDDGDRKNRAETRQKAQVMAAQAAALQQAAAAGVPPQGPAPVAPGV